MPDRRQLFRRNDNVRTRRPPVETNDTWVFWLSTWGFSRRASSAHSQRPLKERDKLATRANSLATRCDGNLEFHPQTVLDEVICHGADSNFRIAERTAGKPVSWEVERVIANVGYRADMPSVMGCEWMNRTANPDARTELLHHRREIMGVILAFCCVIGFEQIRKVFGGGGEQVQARSLREEEA